LFTESPLDCRNKIFPLHLYTFFYHHTLKRYQNIRHVLLLQPSSADALMQGVPFFFDRGPHPLLWAISRATRGKM